MAAVITAEALKAKIDALEANIRRLCVKRKEMENQIRVYKQLLEEATEAPSIPARLPTATEAILQYLSQVESATVSDLVSELSGKFRTNTEPRVAIYASVASLKTRGEIEPVAGDAKRYRIVETDGGEDSHTQRAAS